MKKICSIVALLCTITLFAQTDEVRPVGDFSGISAASGINVQITQGDENKVTVSSSDATILQKIKTTVDKNGILNIYMEYNKAEGWNNKKGVKLSATVIYKSIHKIAASSGANLQTTNVLKTNTISIEASSGATLIANIVADDNKIEVSSGATATLTGSATAIKIEVSSGSVLDATQLQTQSCKATASSGANVKIAVAKKLQASASSGASIQYKGSPDVDKKATSSGGEVKQL